MLIDEATVNAVVNEPDRVIVYDDLATDVVFDNLDDSETPEKVALFREQFEVVEPKRYWLADPDEDFYQGINVMTVIRRKADGRLFGFQWWTPVSKYGEPYAETNGDENGFDYDIPVGFDWDNDYLPSPFVFLPVDPFTVTGYKIATSPDASSSNPWESSVLNLDDAEHRARGES